MSSRGWCGTPTRADLDAGGRVTVEHPQFGTVCEICFTGLTAETCAEDTGGQKWDLCKGQCAWEAGIQEMPEPQHDDRDSRRDPLRGRQA